MENFISKIVEWFLGLGIPHYFWDKEGCACDGNLTPRVYDSWHEYAFHPYASTIIIVALMMTMIIMIVKMIRHSNNPDKKYHGDIRGWYFNSERYDDKVEFILGDIALRTLLLGGLIANIIYFLMPGLLYLLSYCWFVFVILYMIFLCTDFKATMNCTLKVLYYITWPMSAPIKRLVKVLGVNNVRKSTIDKRLGDLTDKERETYKKLID